MTGQGKRIFAVIVTAALLVSAAAVLLSPRWGLADYGSQGANVILISIDTLRGDRLGCSGHHRNTSPFVDRLSEDSVNFRSTYSHAPSTTSSHASIFTSLLPSHHGASCAQHRPIPRQLTTMAERLQADGYDTVSFNDGGQVSAEFGFDHGFDEYNSIRHGAHGHSDFRFTVEQAIAWLRGRKAGRFFLFLHTYQTHHPYTPKPYYYDLMGEAYDGLLPNEATMELLTQINRGERPLTPADREHISTLYDAEIRQMDAAFGWLVSELKRKKLYDDTLIIFTSDHGEEFGEHGTMGWHSHTLYDELLRVPLIIKFPNGAFAGREVDQPVRSIDILPTLLDVLDLEPPKILEGRSLVPMIKGFDRAPRLTIARQDYADPEPVILRTGRWKYYLRPGQQPSLYDLASDPGEQENSAHNHPEVVADLQQTLDEIIAGRPVIETAEGVELSRELQDQLRALGYIDE